MPTGVDVFATNILPPHAALDGVVVSVHDPDTFELLTHVTTGSDGRAAFVLDGANPGRPYELRFYKKGVLFENPMRIEVLEPPSSPNAFDVSGTVITRGTPLDPRLCRCVGRFRDFSNAPIGDVLLRIAADMDLGQKIPKVVDGDMISSSSMELHTDSGGLVVIDLLRGGRYLVQIAGEEDTLWSFQVPDLATANLVDLIHPRPTSLSYDYVGTDVPLVVGAAPLSIPVMLGFTDFQDRPDEIPMWVEFMVDNPDVVTAVFAHQGHVLSLQGRQPGTATVTVATRDRFPITLPPTTVAAPTLTITVTP